MRKSSLEKTTLVSYKEGVKTPRGYSTGKKFQDVFKKIYLLNFVSLIFLIGGY